jgi:hypothetical protein
MIVSWLSVITDHGGLRSRFHHCIDVMPTLMEVAGIAEPTVVNGYVQHPIEGVSFAYTSRRRTRRRQAGGRSSTSRCSAIARCIATGWIASCRHGRLPCETHGSSGFESDTWELYNIAEDFSQAVDLARKEPAKLRELQDLFMAEAARYNVLRLDDRFAERLDVTLRPSFFAGRDKVTFYAGLTRLPEGSGPKLVGIPFTMTVTVEITAKGAGRRHLRARRRCGRLVAVPVGRQSAVPLQLLWHPPVRRALASEALAWQPHDRDRLCAGGADTRFASECHDGNRRKEGCDRAHRRTDSDALRN